MKVEKRTGFTLVLVLAMVTLLAILSVTFMTMVSQERVTSRAFGNAARAQIAAEGCTEYAKALLKFLFEKYPDSATTWEVPQYYPESGKGGSTLYYAREAGGTDWKVFPLHSGAKWSTVAQRASAYDLYAPTKAFEDPINSVELNRASSAGDRFGWMGSPAGGRKSRRVPWVYLRNPETGRAEARYAFAIDDESFKRNLNTMGSNSRGALSPGATPTEIPMESWFRDRFGMEKARELTGDAIALREGYHSKRFSSLSQLAGLFPTAEALEEARYTVTLESGGLNLTRSGALRLNVNALFGENHDSIAVREELDRAIAFLKEEIPDFGQRFYRTTTDLNAKTVPEVHRKIYLEKFAANLRDYCVSDALPPTMVYVGGGVAPIGKPDLGILPLVGPYWPGVVKGDLVGGDNSVIAVGKKNIPYFHEHASRINLKKLLPKSSTEAEYDFFFDFYLEFWNMSPQDIVVDNGDLGENPFVKIYNLPGFDTNGGTPIPEGGEMLFPLDGVVFPAGRCTVLTSDDDLNTALIPEGVQPILIPVAESQRRFQGITKKKAGSFLVIDMIPRSTTATDYQTRLIMGNENGLLESSLALALVRGAAETTLAIQIRNNFIKRPWIDTISGEHREQFFVRGGSLHGTGEPSQTGDPRTNNEQLYLRVYEKGGGEEQTRYYNTLLGDPSYIEELSKEMVFNVPGMSSLGLPNSNFVTPTLWPDAFEWAADGVNAPVFVRSGPMQSIGELGHLFDAARPLGTSRNPLYSRGGGRSFTIGQPDPLWDGGEDSESRTWAAWRLTDLFSTQSAAVIPGQLNINGVLRDGGEALRGLFYRMLFSNGIDADPALAGEAVPEEVVEALVERVKKRLEGSNPQPFGERGEISEIMGTLPGFPQAPRYDRGREELFRRIVELITTKGNVFTIYALGQAVREREDGEIVPIATSRLKTTVELLPEWSPPLLEAFDPGEPLEVAARVRPPDRYRVRVLRVSE